MGDWRAMLGDSLDARVADGCFDLPRRAAFTDGPVADTAEPLAAETGRPVTQPDRDDSDAVGHERMITP